MKMAKASQQDIEAAHKVCSYINELEKRYMPNIPGEDEETEFFNREDPDDCMRALNAILDAADTGSLFRVIFGMAVVCDHRNKVIDPDADTLEVHPEHLRNAGKVDTLTARVAELEKALTWYGEQAEGCRKLGPDGNAARNALDADSGKRAAALLAKGE